MSRSEMSAGDTLTSYCCFRCGVLVEGFDAFCEHEHHCEDTEIQVPLYKEIHITTHVDVPNGNAQENVFNNTESDSVVVFVSKENEEELVPVKVHLYFCMACDQAVPLQNWKEHQSLAITCSYCRVPIVHTRFQAHIRKEHAKKKKFVCPECLEDFQFGDILMKHWGTHIRSGLVCGKLKRNFKLPRARQKAKLLTLQNGPGDEDSEPSSEDEFSVSIGNPCHAHCTLCESCNKQILTKDFPNHLLLQAPCEFCERDVQHALINEHMKWKHKKIMAFPCDCCDRIFRNASKRMRHQIRKHDLEMKSNLVEKETSVVTPKNVGNNSSLNNEISPTFTICLDESMKQYMCSFCPKTFMSTGGLRSHHGNHLACFSFACEFCSHRFLNFEQLSEHIAMTHKDNIKPYVCKYCEEMFTTQEEHRKHQTEHTIPSLVPSTSSTSREELPTDILLTNSQVLSSSVLPDDVAVLCTSCGQEVLLSSWIAHQKLYSICLVCDHFFVHSQLDHHVATSHNNVTCFQCELCDGVFKSASGYLCHLNTHREVRMTGRFHKCPQCGRHFSTRDNLMKHITRHQDVQNPLQTFKCHMCDSKFSTKMERFQHSLCHPNIRWLLCMFCSRMFKTRIELQMHQICHLAPFTPHAEMGPDAQSFPTECVRRVIVETENRIINCEICYDPVLPSAMEQHKKLRMCCDECCNLIPHSEFLVHWMEFHPQVEQRKCPLCDVTFTNILERIQHYKRFHSELQCIITETADGSHHLCCPFCPRVFVTPQHLVSHSRRHINVRPYSCSICSKRFCARGEMWKHNKLHFGEKQCRCMYCPKRFHSNTELKCHILIHTGDKPFPCPKCPKSFRTRSACSAHLTIHSSERNYKCKDCGRACKTMSQLWSHRLVHTKPYKCSICNSTFHSAHIMKSHAQKVHHRIVK